MRVSTNARRGNDLAKGLFEGEWFPNVPAEKRRTAAIGMFVYLLVGVGGTIALLWLTHSF
jgi:hypothetical protein